MDVFRDLNGSFSINSVDSSLAPFSFCNWTIDLPDGNYIALNFTEFDVGKDPVTGVCTDSVEIFITDTEGIDGNSQVLCGDVTPYILTNSSQIKIVFQTGLEVRSLGFQVHYESKGELVVILPINFYETLERSGILCLFYCFFWGWRSLEGWGFAGVIYFIWAGDK